MHSDFQNLMGEAARLTQSGDLAGATALIQRALNGGGAAAADQGAAVVPAAARATAFAGTPFAARFGPGSEAIDVLAREIDGSARDEDLVAGAPATRGSEADVTTQRDRFVERSFIGARGGQHAVKLYVPPQAGRGEPLPLLLMLHGCTQDPDDFARGTAMNDAARAKGFFVLYPAQSQKMNPQRCWNWFKHSHQKRGRGEPALLAGMVRDVAARYAIDESRIYVAGLSAGGAMAAILGEAYPELFAAVGVHSGLAAGAAADLPSALAAMQSGGTAQPARASGSGVPTIVFHGDADGTVHPANAEQVIAASLGSGAALEPAEAAGGGRRRATRRVHRDAGGRTDAEIWLVHGAPHAWSGGSASGSYTDAAGPDASTEMLRFFEQHRQRKVD